MTQWVNTGRAPLVALTFPSVYGFEELDAALLVLEEYYRRRVLEAPGEPVGLIVDASAVEQSSAKNRKRIADSVTELEPILAARAVGQAYVMNNSLARGGLTAILWLRQPPWPVKVFATRAEAEAWLVERFADVGVTIPAS